MIFFFLNIKTKVKQTLSNQILREIEIEEFLHHGCVERGSYTVEVWKRSYTVEARRVLLSVLGCIKYHKRFLCHGSMERFLHRGSMEKILNCRSEDGCTGRVRVRHVPWKIPMSWKRGKVPTLWKCGKRFLHSGSVKRFYTVEAWKRFIQCGGVSSRENHPKTIRRWGRFQQRNGSKDYPKVKVF